jgi:hypothetical protein
MYFSLIFFCHECKHFYIPYVNLFVEYIHRYILLNSSYLLHFAFPMHKPIILDGWIG